MNHNLKKSIFIIILFLVIICSISMVNAVDISDNNLTGDSNHNSLEINYNSNDNLYVPIENESTINNKINYNANKNNNSLKEVSINSKNNSDDFKEIQNSEINNISDLLNINIINRTNNNGIYEINYNHKTLKVYQYYISNEADLKNVSRIVYNNNKSNENILLLDFKNKETFKIMPWSKNLFNSRWNYLIIRGNNATIDVENFSCMNKFHFLNLDNKYSCLINNITITHFNTPIINHGKLNIENSIFTFNEVYYQIFDGEDYGGVIRNYATFNAINSNFTYNYAKKGGVIYNEKGSFSTFINCLLEANWGYHHEGTRDYYLNNIYCCDGAQCIVMSNEFKAYTFNISSVNDLIKASTFIKNNPDKYDCINLNFVSDNVSEMIYSKSYFKGYEYLFDTVNLPILIINGNGLSIKTKDINKNDVFHFLSVNAGSYVIIRNLTLQGFNTPIINHGSLNIENSIFYKNSVDYTFSQDYGGAIRNYGLLHCINSSFILNYAKYGGAIYNDKGILVLEKCDFFNNTAYKHGGAIYNYYAIMLANECNFYNNVAKSEGGAIYNDFSYASFINDDFLNNSANKGGDIYNYASTYDFIILTDYSKNIHTELSTFNKYPSKTVRVMLRIGEIVLTLVAAGIIESTTAGGGTAFVAGAIVGMVLAGAEEMIESVCLDHYMDISGTIYMMVVSGLIDGIATVGGIAAGKFISNSLGKIFTKLSERSMILIKNGVLYGIDVIGEIITEVIPRITDEITIPDINFNHNDPIDRSSPY